MVINDIAKTIELGSRIECANYYGTIRYVGLVQGYISAWLGVEWDNPSRGKHDGCVNGHRYFTTSHPTSGSFVRPEKVTLGKDAVVAVTSRYGRKETPSEANVNQIQLLNLQKEINAPFLEMVGFDKINEKQSNLQDLQIICLRLQFVNGPGAPGDLGKICPNIVELDVSKNLFNKWTDIFIICDQLPNLVWLNVSENLLQLPEDTEAIIFPSVKNLICGRMSLNWNDVLKLAAIFPNLEELRVQHNNITAIEMTDGNYLQHIKLLDLEGNSINDWEQINKLGDLQTLEKLQVSNIGISRIKFEHTNTKISKFCNLNQLAISENNIDNWESINELEKLQHLEELRFLKNPIFNTEKPATCTQLIIARISKLNMLNGTYIKGPERKGAEYDYIKKHGLEWLKVAENEEMRTKFLQTHPRYLELINKHGVPEESELIYKAQTLKTSLTLVHIQCNENIITKKLPTTMTLQKLIMLVQKLFKLERRPNLYYISSLQPDVQLEMQDEFKELTYYSMQDGDQIFVKNR